MVSMNSFSGDECQIMHQIRKWQLSSQTEDIDFHGLNRVILTGIYSFFADGRSLLELLLIDQPSSRPRQRSALFIFSQCSLGGSSKKP